MSYSRAIALLFLAALLEAGGDALVRKGLHSAAIARVAFLLAGAAVLFIYACAVNSPSWDFGKMIGVYVMFFFVVAQIIGWLAFGQAPTPKILVGGACIIAGGLIISA